MTTYVRYLGDSPLESFNFEPVSESTVHEIISIKNLAHGYDQLPTQIYKEYFRLRGCETTKNCNTSLQLEEFTKENQIANFKCLFKAGDKKFIEFYPFQASVKLLSKLLISK